jgi:hypothetical protein
MHTHILAGDFGYLPSYNSGMIDLKDSDNEMQDYLNHLRDSVDEDISDKELDASINIIFDNDLFMVGATVDRNYYFIDYVELAYCEFNCEVEE